MAETRDWKQECYGPISDTSKLLLPKVQDELIVDVLSFNIL